jgi:hypothetical protein
VATLQEIKDELTNGPLAADIAPFLTMVFNDEEPLRTKLADRQGMLTPDAAFEISKILNDSTKIPTAFNKVSNSVFVKAITPILLKVSSLSDSKRNYWTMVLDIFTDNDEIDLNNPDLTTMLDNAINDNLLNKKQKDSILALKGISTQSRLQELGWSLSTEELQRCIQN